MGCHVLLAIRAAGAVLLVWRAAAGQRGSPAAGPPTPSSSTSIRSASRPAPACLHTSAACLWPSPHPTLTQPRWHASPSPQVARMAPAANRLASCNKNTARLAAQLSARTNALSRCNSDASGLNKQLRCVRVVVEGGRGTGEGAGGGAGCRGGAARRSRRRAHSPFKALPSVGMHGEVGAQQHQCAPPTRAGPTTMSPRIPPAHRAFAARRGAAC